MPPTSVKISFLGGASAIGASCALVQVADQSFLVDCGVRFRSDRALPDLEQLAGNKLDAILVTHAHSDHTGALAVVHEAYPAAPIYMTPPTRSLVEILQRDAIKLMRSMSEREAEIPLYTERQVEGMLGRVMPVHHEASFVLGDVRITYLPASHILGASMIHLETPAGNILFSGDYSVAPQRSVPGLPRPSLPVDLVLTESTYGNRAHADRKLAEERLLRTITEVTEKRGRVLIPAFAIGRAQEVLLVLREAQRQGKIPQVPIFIDGMVRSVCGVYPQHERYLAPAVQRWIKSSGHPFFGDQVRAVGDVADRRQIASGGPCIVIASSGMLTGGPSAFYASEFAPNEQDAILITGYQDEESPGRALLDLARNQGPRRLAVAGKEVDVRCRFEAYSLSAHADRMQMVGLIEAINPQTVALVHGDHEAKETLAQSLGPRDVVLCEDGVSIERTFVRRRGEKRPSRPHIDRGKAERLVGLDLGIPLTPTALGTAWFGHEVTEQELKAFLEELLQLGVMRRDEQGNLFSTRKPIDDEQALEEEFRRENPKGKLIEWCNRGRIEAPLTSFHQDGQLWVATLAVKLGEQSVESGPQKARNQKNAEQLAARALLEKLRAEEQKDGEVRQLTPADLQRLRSLNPKGKIFELCAKYKLKHPSFEQKIQTRGSLCRGTLKFSGGRSSHSSWNLGPSMREAEQGASEELLNILWAWKNGNLDPAKVTGGDSEPLAPVAGKNPKMRLNELQQTRKIEGFGFDLIEQKGTLHAPIFVMQSWAVRAGERILGEPREASNKRDAELLTAALLLALLEPPHPA